KLDGFDKKHYDDKLNVNKFWARGLKAVHKILIWSLGRCIGLAGLLSTAVMLSACGDILDANEPGTKKNHAATVFPVATPAWQACETVFPGDAGLADPPGGRYECAVVQ